MNKFFGLLLVLSQCLQAQHKLEDYLRKAEANSPLLKEYENQIKTSSLQKDLIRSQQQLPQISFTAGYLFAPYFNNNGHLISTNPGPDAIGYDVGITNGGLYAAQINVEKPIFNARMIDAANNVQTIQEASVSNTIALARRDLTKQVTDLYLQSFQSQQLYALSKETAAYAKQGLDILGGLVRQGTAKRSEYLLMSIEVEGKAAAAADAYVQYAVNLRQLNSLCGLDDTT
ncbi:MAG TPA: TolC family protein, partial [Bacteroidota bacterium]|nr:TolC family protein [Bacteroidota bacterium]